MTLRVILTPKYMNRNNNREHHVEEVGRIPLAVHLCGKEERVVIGD